MLTRIQSDALAMCKSIEIPEDILMPSCLASIDEEIMYSNGEDYFTMGVSNAWTDYQIVHAMGIEDEEERQAFLTACRICRRHKYSPYKEKYGYVSLNRYREYVSRLLYFHKDVHNPHYVCPADFDAAEEEITRKYNRLTARQRIAEEHRRQIERMAKDKKAIAAFEQRMARYSDLRFATTNFYIVPCTTADAMMHEGEVMHHCVFEMRYFAKENCQIWLVRRPDGSPISTIELNTECWSIVQNRGKYNAVPDFLAESNSLLMANIETIQNHNIKTVAA